MIPPYNYEILQYIFDLFFAIYLGYMNMICNTAASRDFSRVSLNQFIFIFIKQENGTPYNII